MKIRLYLLPVLLLLLTLSGCDQKKEPFNLSAKRMEADTKLLCTRFPDRVTGTLQEREACDWLEEQLVTIGFSKEAKTLYRTSFEGMKGMESENLIAVTNPNPDIPLISIITHYDSFPGTPGAADNAAGAAILLELARYLGSENSQFPCEIRLVFLGSEENGYHGSRAYADSLSKDDLARHRGAYNMDISAAAPSEQARLVCYTLGGFDENGVYMEGNLFEPAENQVSLTLRTAYKELYGKELGSTHHIGESDHISFHNQELEAANLCWRRIEEEQPRLPATYHKPEDLADGLDYNTARTTGRCILRAAQLLSEALYPLP